MRRAKTPASSLGDKLRTFAKAYGAAGQRERAEGLIQAATAVDADLAGTTTGLVDDPIVQALLAAVDAVTRAAERITEAAADLAAATAVAGELHVDPGRLPAPPTTTNGAGAPSRPRREPTALRAAAAARAPHGERRLLIAIAQHARGVTREQLSVLTGYKRSSRDTYLQRLRARGAVEETDRIRATSSGRAELGPDYKPLPTGLELRAYWLSHLPEGERRILVTVLRLGRCPTRDEITAATGYRRSSRDTYIQRLRARQLLDVTPAGALVASRDLYDLGGFAP